MAVIGAIKLGIIIKKIIPIEIGFVYMLRDKFSSVVVLSNLRIRLVIIM